MRARRLLASTGALAVALLSSAGLTGAAAPIAASGSGSGCESHTSAARVEKGATAKEPALFDKKDANKYGVIKPHARLANGSVTIDTVFHVISDHTLTAAENTRMNTMIGDQVRVLNESYSGKTGTGAADTPFRFALTRTTHTVNKTWYAVVPGKAGVERDMKKALYEGDATTLNVYVANIGGGLLGWAYYPKGYNNGRDFIDGVVMLDESMPGGVDPETGKPWKYGLGDTLTHEVGHWLMLDHTFAGGCSASGDGVADTPREAQPQFDCPIGADTCAAPGKDPIHNFMDYSQDSCMYMFTNGQAKRMSDAYIDFRDPTAGS
jgi:hypothetical protein